MSMRPDEPPEDPTWKYTPTFHFPTPMDVLKWASVVFVIALYVLFVVSTILAIIGAF